MIVAPPPGPGPVGQETGPETCALPFVSVIIPTHNRRGVLDRAIASARAQSLPPGEIIIVDDASADGSADWLRRIHPDLRLIVLAERGGAPRARNIGIQAARGDYIAFLDSDDAFTKDKLQRQIDALNHSGAIFSTCGFADPRGRRYCVAKPGPGLILRRNCLGGTSGLVARKADLLATGFDTDLPAVQDWDLYLRLLQRGAVAHIPEALYDYGLDQRNRITLNPRRRFLGHAALWRRHIKGARGLSWRIHATHRAGLRMLACAARSRPGFALLWRGIYRLLAG